MRSLIIAIYMGTLPELMPLWLRSAGFNPDVEFLLVCDSPPAEVVPANVKVQLGTLAELRTLWSERLGFAVSLDSAYKLCDFKPLFWMLANDIDAYDYWGFCDLDVVFGDIGIMTEGRLGHYDMIGSEGHLRFFRNDDFGRNVWREMTKPYTWQEALSQPQIFGLDEHNGINLLYKDGDRSWYADSSRIADIDPSFRQMRRMARLPNHDCQAFHWDQGRIYREYWADGRYGRDEYAYIHLQKRRQPIDPDCLTAPSINIDPQGLVPRSVGDDQPAALVRRNPWKFPTLIEARIQLREFVREWRGIEHVIHPVDRRPARG